MVSWEKPGNVLEIIIFQFFGGKDCFNTKKNWLNIVKTSLKNTHFYMFNTLFWSTKYSVHTCLCSTFPCHRTLQSYHALLCVALYYIIIPPANSLGEYIGISLSVCLDQLPHLLSDFHQTLWNLRSWCVNFAI